MAQPFKGFRRSKATPAVSKSLRPWPEPKSTISGRTQNKAAKLYAREAKKSLDTDRETGMLRFYNLVAPLPESSI
jgi:hypothetical protein